MSTYIEALTTEELNNHARQIYKISKYRPIVTSINISDGGYDDQGKFHKPCMGISQYSIDDIFGDMFDKMHLRIGYELTDYIESIPNI